MDHETKDLLRELRGGWRASIWLPEESMWEDVASTVEVLAALSAVADDATFEKFASELTRARRMPFPFIPMVAAWATRLSVTGRSRILGSVIGSRAIQSLTKALALPSRVEGDWTIAWSLDCRCSECGIASAFLASGEVSLQLSLPDQRLEHVRREVDRSRLPIEIWVRPLKGSQLVELRKTEALFEREHGYRASLREMLRELER